MEVWYSVTGSTKIEISKEDFKQMLKDKVNIEDINEIDTWVRKNIDIYADIFNTDIDEEEIEDYCLEPEEEEILKKLKYEKEKDLAMKNQIDLFGRIIL